MSNPAWAGDYAKTIVEVMRVLGRHNRVLYVENPPTWLDLFRKSRRAVLSSIFSKAKVVEHHFEEGKVHVLTPGPVLPVNFLPAGKLYAFFQLLNSRKLHRQIKKQLDMLGMRERLIHINAFNPLVARGNFGKFGERTLVYYCYDEIRAAHYMKKHGSYLEKEMLRKADITVVSSEGLLEAKAPLAKRIALVKNGVNFSLFSRGFVKESPRTVKIGYLGSIDDRLDMGLLKSLFETRPEWLFEFVGRITDKQVEAFLRSFKNVSLLGAYPPEELPAFLRNYSAGIIPFVRNRFTEGIYPLKINEYLAAGIPVVMTAFGKMDEFRDIALITDNSHAFITGLAHETGADNPEKREKRKNFAALNSWESRVEDLSKAIHGYESTKPFE
jgi:glycosyltransferase involved in cell wall biosynthesis